MTDPGDRFMFGDSEIDALIDSGDLVEDTGSELQELGRRIAGQYVDAVLPFVQSVFRGRAGSESVEALRRAGDALSRLASATRDRSFERVLAELPELVQRSTDARPAQRSGFLRDLREWVLSLAELLGGSDAARLRSRFDASEGNAPLLEHLREVPGIGERRIQRLYCAGLYTADALERAEISDVAAVTGIPEGVVRRSVEASERFVEQRRASMARRLEADAREILDLATASASSASPSGEADDPLVAAIRRAVRDLQASLNTMIEE